MSLSLASKEETSLIIIDVQEKLFIQISENEKLVEKLIKLIRFAQILEIPIVLTEQYPKGLGQTIPAIKCLLPSLQPIEKMEFSCFGSSKFVDTLSKIKARTLILTGIETHICVMQTAIEGLKNNYKIYVVEDATSSRNLQDKSIAIQRMIHNGATIVSTEMLIYELLRKAGTPQFKKSLEIVK
ncbi:MAG: hydrolase [Candidatus Jordarchaeaceae archaeon]